MRHHHKIVYFFKDAEAIDETSAIPYEKFDNVVNIKIGSKRKIRGRNWVFKRLLQKKVIVKNPDNYFYLDLESFEDYKKWYFVVAISIIIPSIIFLLLGIAWILTAV